MAILAVNAGSSSLKFSLHPLLGGRVRPSVLSGTIEGLEPGGQPEMAWTFAGQRQRKADAYKQRQPKPQHACFVRRALQCRGIGPWEPCSPCAPCLPYPPSSPWYAVSRVAAAGGFGGETPQGEANCHPDQHEPRVAPQHAGASPAAQGRH